MGGGIKAIPPHGVCVFCARFLYGPDTRPARQTNYGEFNLTAVGAAAHDGPSNYR